MNLLGTDYSQSPRSEFLQSPNADRGVPYSPGVFVVHIAVFILPPDYRTNPRFDYALAASTYAALRAVLMAEPFPKTPGILRLFSSQLGSPDLETALATLTRQFLAVASAADTPEIIGSETGSNAGIWSTIYLSIDDSRMVDGGQIVPAKNGAFRLGVTKTMLVFGGGFPYPASGRFCVYDAALTAPTYLGVHQWFTRRIDPENNNEGMVLTRRRAILPPPTALEFYGGDYYASRRNDRAATPVIVRRLRTDWSAPDTTNFGGAGYPPAPLDCQL